MKLPLSYKCVSKSVSLACHRHPHRLLIIIEFRLHVIRLLLRREVSQIIADIYELYANATERSILPGISRGARLLCSPYPRRMTTPPRMCAVALERTAAQLLDAFYRHYCQPPSRHQGREKVSGRPVEMSFVLSESLPNIDVLHLYGVASSHLSD